MAHRAGLADSSTAAQSVHLVGHAEVFTVATSAQAFNA